MPGYGAGATARLLDRRSAAPRDAVAWPPLLRDHHLGGSTRSPTGGHLGPGNTQRSHPRTWGAVPTFDTIAHVVVLTGGWRGDSPPTGLKKRAQGVGGSSGF